ncbi:MAG: hypothetical protein IJ649_08935 [Oscillospiraceae bacterium]|nr:hypothetical protein [Oscillospiraceae bacterium]
MSAFTKWVDGETAVPLKTDFKPIKEKKPKEKHSSLGDRQRLDGFLKLYAKCAVVISVLMLLVLLIGAVALPTFAEPGNPTDNEVVERYVSSALEETGAENVISGMILNYRGFDTFGESCVLFLAVACVQLLLWATSDKIRAEARDSERTAPRDAILSNVSRLLIPCVLVFGLCVMYNGNLTPGGGFSGGSILGAGLILTSLAFGAGVVHRFFPMHAFEGLHILGLMVYAIMFGVYIYQGANGIDGSLARYIVLVMNVTVGFVVMSTMYGFYSFYTKGEL